MSAGYFSEDSETSPRGLLQGLTIRAARVDDCEALAALVNLPRFRAGTLRLPYQTVESTRKWLEKQSADSLNIVAVLNETIVGSAGLDRYSGRRMHAAGLGMGVHDDYHGKGIGTALLAELIDVADNWLGLKRIGLTVYTDNAPAIALYKKFGFETEGILRAYAFRAGSFVDAYSMARLRM